MNLTTTSDYHTLLLLLTDPEFVATFGKISFERPAFDLEGFCGYVKVNVLFEDIDLTNFAKKWEQYQYFVPRTPAEQKEWVAGREKQVQRLTNIFKLKYEDTNSN